MGFMISPGVLDPYRPFSPAFSILALRSPRTFAPSKPSPLRTFASKVSNNRPPLRTFETLPRTTARPLHLPDRACPLADQDEELAAEELLTDELRSFRFGIIYSFTRLRSLPLTCIYSLLVEFSLAFLFYPRRLQLQGHHDISVITGYGVIGPVCFEEYIFIPNSASHPHLRLKEHVAPSTGAPSHCIISGASRSTF